MSRFGIGESPSSVNTDENWLLRTSAFPLASPTVLPSFFSDATQELSHFLFLTNEYSFFLLLPSLTMELTVLSCAFFLVGLLKTLEVRPVFVIVGASRFPECSSLPS